jgi:acyl carrier protein
MPNEFIARRLRELLAYHSGAPEVSLRTDSTPQNTEGWDSLANLNLMAAIEDEFGVTVATRDVVKLRTLGDIAAYVEENAVTGRTG